MVGVDKVWVLGLTADGADGADGADDNDSSQGCVGSDIERPCSPLLRKDFQLQLRVVWLL